METIIKKISQIVLILPVLVFGSGCAGHSNIVNNSLDGPHYANSFKQLNNDYATAGTAAERNAALEGYSDLAARSPNKASADLVKKMLCPAALAEGRVDLVEGICADSEITMALLKR